MQRVRRGDQAAPRMSGSLPGPGRPRGPTLPSGGFRRRHRLRQTLPNAGLSRAAALMVLPQMLIGMLIGI